MSKIRLASLILFILLFIPGKSLTQDSPVTMSVSEMRAGMEGYGLSVFQGEKITRFNVKILGVLLNAKPGRSIILARCSGQYIDFANVQQGMSGSPVYINERLIGAVAYTWGDAMEPIAGIQPIGDMIEILQRQSTPDNPPVPFDMQQLSMYGEPAALPTAGQIHGNSFHAGMRPVPTPLVITGMHPAVFSILKERFSGLGFQVQAGGSADTSVISNKTTLEPGDAVGAMIVGGDVHISAIGTVTYKKGNHVLIFGHPLLKRGATLYFMTRAYVHHIFAFRKLSWKIASATRVVGAITQDRETGVGGVLGMEAPTIPIQITIKDNDSSRTFNYSVVKDPVLFSDLFASLLASSLFEKVNTAFAGTLNTTFSVKFQDLATQKIHNIEFNDFYPTTDPKILMKKIAAVIKPVQYILYNWFEKVKILSVNAKVETDTNFNIASIIRLRVFKNRAKPGDTVSILATFKPFRGEPVDRIYKIQIPQNITEDKFIVFIGSAKVESLSHQRTFKEYYNPVSIEHMVKALNRRSRNEDLVLWYDLKVPGIISHGRILSNLPPGRAYVYGPQNEIGTAYPATFQRVLKYFPSNYMIHGWGKVEIEMNYE